MELIPAIDMMDGKCVRLKQGKFDQVTIYSDNPVEMAIKWESQGATRLHLVDLNGSRYGSPQELTSIKKIIDAVKIPVQVGGGIRDLETSNKLIEMGVGRVIIGTTAALDEDIAVSIFSSLGDNAILAVDAKDGFVAVKGWEESTKQTAVDFAVKMQNIGAKRVIYTDISRDGMMQGANISAMQTMAEALNIPVIASGGVSTIDDINKLRILEPKGIEGAILGKALYTGELNLAELIFN